MTLLANTAHSHTEHITLTKLATRVFLVAVCGQTIGSIRADGNVWLYWHMSTGVRHGYDSKLDALKRLLQHDRKRRGNK